jgi:4-amino-4-deoxy-L-arabinose transferase-like glycosyltransferase
VPDSLPQSSVSADNPAAEPGDLRRLALLLAVALGIRIATAVFWQAQVAGDRFVFGDSESYWTLARTIAAGEPFEYGRNGPRIFRTPGYPALLAPLFLIFGGDPPVMAARCLSAIFSTIAVAGAWLLAWRLFGRAAAWLAGLAAAFYPGLIALGVLVLTEPVFCALLPLQLLLWSAAWQAGGERRRLLLALAAGLAAAAATLVRPSWLLFVPFAAAIGLAFGHPRTRHALIAAGLMTGLIAGMLPWWLRNARVAGHFVPTTLQMGASLYDGLNPHATGASDMAYVPHFIEIERRAEASGEANLEDPFEYRLDRRMRDAAVAWARENPSKALRLALVKFVRIWNVWPNEPAFSTTVVRLAVAATYLPLLLLGLAGAAWTTRRGWPYALCWLPALYLTLMHIVFVGSIRYREPAMIGLIVLAAGATAAWSGREKR